MRENKNNYLMGKSGFGDDSILKTKNTNFLNIFHCKNNRPRRPAVDSASPDPFFRTQKKDCGLIL